MADQEWPEGTGGDRPSAAIEAEFPGCRAYYATPIAVSYGTPGDRAWLPGRRYAQRPLRADTPQETTRAT